MQKGIYMNPYISYIRDEEEQLIGLIKKIVEVESPTPQKQQNDLLAELISEIFIQYTGGTIEKISDEIFGSHMIGTVGDGEQQILLVGHFDTVHPFGTIQRNPYKVEDGKIFGPGIYDMKAGLMQGIFALHTLVKMNELTNKRVKFIFNSDEELGSRNSKQLLIKEAKKSKVAFVLEPSFGEEGAIKLARKGVGTYTIKANGKPAHAGNTPEDGENAIEEISRQVLKLQGLNDLERGVTVNCGVIQGGTTKNTIPEFAELTVDVRVPTLDDLNKMESVFSLLTPYNPNVKLSVEGGFTRPPMEPTEKSEEIFSQAKEFIEKEVGLTLRKAHVGGASDGNNISQYVPTLDGLGAVGFGAHTVDEYIYKEHIVPRTAMLAALIRLA